MITSIYQVLYLGDQDFDSADEAASDYLSEWTSYLPDEVRAERQSTIDSGELTMSWTYDENEKLLTCTRHFPSEESLEAHQNLVSPFRAGDKCKRWYSYHPNGV